ncbi:MAG: fructosamine kinase family protein [Spirochaetota bacterium]
MSAPAPVEADTLEDAVALIASPGARVASQRAVSGGCIANASRLELDDGSFWFAKRSATLPVGMFRAEATGLGALARAGGVRVPAVRAVNRPDAAEGFIVMEWIEHGPARPDTDTRTGRGLAQMHREAGDGRFGFRDDNYIGASVQENCWMDSWHEFFGERRLRPQVRMARDKGLLDAELVGRLDALIGRLESLLPEPGQPSLLHGDLWGGNAIVGANGEPVLIDPAVYYGHREADLAMTELFGGFGAWFMRAYEEAWPLDSGYRERAGLYNLYHLLNHANLFGSSYVSGIRSVVSRYS